MQTCKSCTRINNLSRIRSIQIATYKMWSQMANKLIQGKPIPISHHIIHPSHNTPIKALNLFIPQSNENEITRQQPEKKKREIRKKNCLLTFHSYTIIMGHFDWSSKTNHSYVFSSWTKGLSECSSGFFLFFLLDAKWKCNKIQFNHATGSPGSRVIKWFLNQKYVSNDGGGRELRARLWSIVYSRNNFNSEIG